MLIWDSMTCNIITRDKGLLGTRTESYLVKARCGALGARIVAVRYVVFWPGIIVHVFVARANMALALVRLPRAQNLPHHA